MSEISASYQPNKIKRKGYTSWIDESNQFCTTTTGITLDQVRGQNLMDAFDVDWSAYKIDGQTASATSIINKLNTPATAINNFLGVLEDQNELLDSQDRSTKERSYWIVGADIDIIIEEKTYKSLHAGDQVIINVGAHDYKIEDASGFEQCYYCVQINMSGYLPLIGGIMKGSISFKNEFNTIYGDDNNLHLDAHTAINLKAQETIANNIFPQTDTANIGSSSNAFNDIYANRFVKAGYNDNYVLLAGGGAKALSDLPGYLRLSGGTMTGAIDFDWNGPDIHNMLTWREQGILQLDETTNNNKLYLGTAAKLPLTVHELTTNGNILPSTSAPEMGPLIVPLPGESKPTYISLGSDDNYFEKVYARQFKGLADNALKLYAYGTGFQSRFTPPEAVNKGDASTPVYFKDGEPVACNSIPTSTTVASWGYVTSSGITKLNVGDGLQGKANNGDPVDAITTSVGTITLKTATTNILGGIKIAKNNPSYTVTTNTSSISGNITTSGKYYGVEIDKTGKAFVYVPWTDTDSKVTQSESTSNGLYPLLCKYDTTNTSITNSVNFVSGITVNPSTGAVNAQAFYETSDARKKEIKSDLSLDKCYELIDKCQTVIYSLKDQTKEQVGMIAQEIEEFFPEVVATDEEGFKSLAYDRLVVICFKVLKDVIKRLEKLES